MREACDRHGIVAGIHCGTWETAAGWREEGFRMLNVASDAVFLRGAAAEVVKSLTGEPAPKPTTSSYA